jgi:hypothetical protein
MPINYKLKYDINAATHYNRAAQCLEVFNEHNNPNYLFYASLELRNCIERFLFEQLVLIHLDEEKLQKFKNEYRTKNFRRAILESEPQYYEKIEFMNIYFEALGAPFRIPEPDFDTIDTFYGRLGNYLHSLKMPSVSTESPEWWENFHSLLGDIMNFMAELLRYPQAHFKLNESGNKIFEDYLNGEKNREEVIISIQEDL